MGLPLTRDGWPPAPIRTERLVLRAPEAPEDHPGRLVVEHEGRAVGRIGLHRREPGRPARTGPEATDLELGLVLVLVLSDDAWARGYATEAAAALLLWCDEHLGEPVVLRTPATDRRSVDLATRLGFTEVARLEEEGAQQWMGVRHPVLRHATAADAAALAHVADEAYSPYLARMGGLRPGPLLTDYAAAIEESEAWVAVADEDVVGLLLLVPETDAMLLENVAVLPSHHGRGLGRALLSLAESRARALGLDRIRLYTHESMIENQRLYSAIGYTETHRATEHGLTRVFFDKPL